MTLRFLFLLLTLAVLCKTEEIKVYVVVNSHLDAGWLSTYDQYFLGTGPSRENVTSIYDNLIPKLEQNTSWIYTVSEICFFSRWYDGQSDLMKTRVKNLVENKQLEFVNGGWVAHDEATTTYEDMLENLAQGSIWLKNALGVKVDIGWQLDSFGTSSTHASLLAQADYRILFFSRLDYNERRTRRNNQELEFIWKPSSPHNSTLLTHIFGDDYGNVPYLRRVNHVEQLFRGPNLSQKDLDEIETYINKESKLFKSSDFLFTMVEDFYSPAQDYDGMQNLINYYNNKNDSNISAGFSTLANFTDHLYKDLDMKALPTKTDDFFPYTSYPGQTWVGYFSSKPSFKALVRATSHYLNAMRALYMRMTFSIEKQNSDGLWEALTKLGRVVGLLQHHDAVTGTSTEKVRYDFENMIMEAIEDVEAQLQIFLESFVEKEHNITLTKNQNVTEKSSTVPNSLKLIQRPIQERQLDSLLEVNKSKNFQLILDPISWAGTQFKDGKKVYDDNIPSSFFTDDSKPFYVFGFNPGATPEGVVSLKVPTRDSYSLRVEDSTGQKYLSEVFCLSIPHDVCYLRWIDQVPRLKTKVYRIIKDSTITLKAITGNDIVFTLPSSDPSLNQSQAIKISGSLSLSILSDYQTLLLTTCGSSSSDCKTDHIQLKYMYYTSYGSGAYTFSPGYKNPIININGARLYKSENFIILEVYNKKVTSQLIFRTSDPSKLTGFEVITLVEGSIADSDRCDIVLSLKYLNLTQNNGSNSNSSPFYVDTNGYYFASRTYQGNQINTNFYPMTTMMFVNDAHQRMTIITDRAQAVTQIPSGEIEIMIHRIPKQDDHKGLEEALDEKDPNTGLRLNVTTRHFVLLTDALDSNNQAQLRSLVYEQPLQLMSVSNIEDKSFGSNKQIISLISDDSESTKPSKQDIDLNFIKLSVVGSANKSVLIRLHNIHDSQTQNFSFCTDNSISTAFLKMIGSPSSLVSIKTISEQHLTNYNTLAAFLCQTPISLLPQELRTFQLAFLINTSKSSISPNTPDDPSNPNTLDENPSTNDSSSNLWIWGIIAAYFVCGMWISCKLMVRNRSFGISSRLKVVFVLIAIMIFWPLIIVAIAILRASKRERQLLEDEKETVDQGSSKTEQNSTEVSNDTKEIEVVSEKATKESPSEFKKVSDLKFFRL